MSRFTVQRNARRAASAMCLAGLAALPGAPAGAGDQPLLVLEQKIPLGRVSGRIDHLAVDVGRQRLFVAELGNNTVAVVDVRTSSLIRNLGGLKKPQGVAYVRSTDTLYVANAGDGSVLMFQGPDLIASGRIDLGEDADNVRVNESANKVFVGYGNGALAVIDPARRAKVADIPLPAHPESFQLAASGALIFVNLPDVRQIAIVDMQEAKVRVTWAIDGREGNFPMAIDEGAQRVLVAFRRPAKLQAFDLRDGALATSADSCGDADDLFVDAKRRRVYMSCGEGYVDVFEALGDRYVRVEHIATAEGARTALFAPELDRLFVAVRATWTEPAAIWVFKPQAGLFEAMHGNRDMPRQ
jgi:YVTN family beta-propeller protein